MTTQNGEDKLIAVARHIAQTLGHTDNTMTDDILQIFSSFDNRLREKLTQNITMHKTNSSLDRTVKNLERRIGSYLVGDDPIWGDHDDAVAFLDAVDELTEVIQEWSDVSDDDKVTSCLDRAEELLRKCCVKLEDEFRVLVDFPGGVDFLESGCDDAIPASTVRDLGEIAKRMVAAGYGKECSAVYSGFRRGFLEESLARLGFLGLRDNDNDNDVEIEKWTKAINIAVKVFYPSERRICDRVFGSGSGTDAVTDMSFMDVCRVSVLELLNFANGIAMGSRTPERLFKILDVYEVVKELLPEFEVLFSDDYSLFLRNETVSVWKRLGESIRGIFVELENLIKRDPVKAAVPGGGLHPITRYVMNYLRAACSRPTLEHVFEDDVDQSLASSIAWIMEVLESNLESKSKVYRDPALASVFMMNNGRYIVKKVKGDVLGTVLGDDWIRKQTSKVRQYHTNYQRSSWHKLLNTLKLDNNLASNVASKSLKDKLKVFNSQFDEICRTQSTWAIFDEQLREELKISVAGNLLPAYRNFLGRFHNLQDIGKYADKHVKFSIEDVEARIDDLFQATAVSGSSRR
ncbi:Cullin repeat-like-containing domain-containing protein [Artemisia annua]|uniref:Exocyst subunit Exo70 family protein n=1 Tax=Artemisia annua TaxID=35608 RepID=A0A2U1PTF9_ARTAN|nr:Cullin repeat-like-containing domain-containing protein [Artemisia annua]